MKKKIVVALVGILLLMTLMPVLGQMNQNNTQTIKESVPTQDTTTRDGPSEYPVWIVGDKWNYDITYWDIPNMNSYTFTSWFEVKNVTTWTTPQGTYNVYGMATYWNSTSSSSGSGWSSSGYGSSTGTTFYRTSDLALVASSVDQYTHTVVVSGGTK